MAICVPTGKWIHRLRVKAEAHLRSLQDLKHYKNGHVYFCRYCQAFHVGRQKQIYRNRAPRRR